MKSKARSPSLHPEKFRSYCSYEYDPFSLGVIVQVVKGPFADWRGTVARQVSTFHSPCGMVIQRGIVIRLSDGTEVGPYMPDELAIAGNESGDS